MNSVRASVTAVFLVFSPLTRTALSRSLGSRARFVTHVYTPTLLYTHSGLPAPLASRHRDAGSPVTSYPRTKEPPSPVRSPLYMFPCRRALLAVAATAALAALAAPAFAFDSKGHNVIEATAYRTLVEGYDGQPPRPGVLRDLINDGALDAPWCFGRGDSPPGDCRDAPAENPLLCWPQPETDRPDAFFRRQFSDSGQCFHYMGTLTDSLSEPLPGTPRSPARSRRAPSSGATTSSTASCGRSSWTAAPARGGAGSGSTR